MGASCNPDHLMAARNQFGCDVSTGKTGYSKNCYLHFCSTFTKKLFSEQPILPMLQFSVP